MLKRYSISCAFLYLLINTANGQSANAHAMAVNLNNAIEIAFTSNVNGVIMSFNTTTQMQSGVISPVSTLRVRSNRSFNVAVRSLTTHFVSNSLTPMPVSVLSVRQGSSSYVSLSTTNKNLLTNQARGIRTYSINYRAIPGFNYDAGTYVATVVYTATQL